VKATRVRHTTVTRAAAHTTVPRTRPRKSVPPPQPIVRTMTEPETSLLDVIDSLLNKGVVLNADVILALADVDLVYLRLSALLCAADRVAGMDSRRAEKPSPARGRTAPRTARAR
jgi:hypothetical protein